MADPELVVGNELVVRDGTGAMLVPTRDLVLTHAAVLLKLPTLTQAVADLDTITLDTQPKAKQVLAEVRSARKQAEQHHDLQKAPINDVRTYALSLEKDDVGRFKSLETKLGAKLLAFETDLEHQRKEEQDRLHREAIAAAQLEAESRAQALRDAAKAEDDAAVKRQLQAQARALKNAPVFVAPVEVESPVVKTSTVTRWSAEITDVLALVKAVAAGLVPLAALEPDRLIESHPWLNTAASQAREEFVMPGVQAVSKTGLSGR